MKMNTFNKKNTKKTIKSIPLIDKKLIKKKSKSKTPLKKIVQE